MELIKRLFNKLLITLVVLGYSACVVFMGGNVAEHTEVLTFECSADSKYCQQLTRGGLIDIINSKGELLMWNTLDELRTPGGAICFSGDKCPLLDGIGN